MSDMNVLLPKLFRQTLRQSPRTELARRKSTSDDISPRSRRRACKNQCALLAITLLNLVLLEREDRSAGEGKRGCDACLQSVLHVLGCYVEERLPYAVPNVEYCCADCIVGFGEGFVNRGPGRRYVVVRV